MSKDPVKIALAVQGGLSPVCAEKEAERKAREKIRHKEYREKNRDKILASKKEYHRKKRDNDPVYRENANRRAREWRKANPEWQARLMREASLKRKYGLTVEDYEVLLRAQNNGCAICGSATADVKHRMHLFVDHDHDSGRVRGLLCNPCNVGIAKFKENPSLLEAAAKYLGGHNADGSS